jgi:hypothetical protein
LILQLDNLLTKSLTGQYASEYGSLQHLIFSFVTGNYTATLHATFYASSAKYPPAKKADLIIPIATLANDTGAQASVPPQFNV